MSMMVPSDTFGSHAPKGGSYWYRLMWYQSLRGLGKEGTMYRVYRVDSTHMKHGAPEDWLLTRTLIEKDG